MPSYGQTRRRKMLLASKRRRGSPDSLKIIGGISSKCNWTDLYHLDISPIIS